MNAMQLAKTAYTSTSTPVRTARGTEYDAFAKVTHRLKSLCRKRNFPDFAKALHDNRQLWNILAIDVADQENALPQQLRAQIFYLAEFTSQHTSKVLGQDAEVQPLVDINFAIMRGLNKEGTV